MTGKPCADHHEEGIGSPGLFVLAHGACGHGYDIGTFRLRPDSEDLIRTDMLFPHNPAHVGRLGQGATAASSWPWFQA